MQAPTDIKRDTWRLVIESVVLLSTFFVAYGSHYEIISAVVGMHFVHVIVITLISINGTKNQGTRKTINEYFSTYSTVTMTLDCLALFVVAVRTALATRLNIYLTLEQLVYTILYVVHVVALIAIDIYNLMHPLSSTVKETVDTFFSVGTRGERAGPERRSSVTPYTRRRSTEGYVPPGGNRMGEAMQSRLQIRIPPLRLGPPVDMGHPSLRYRNV